MTIDTKPLSERLRSWPKYAPTAEELSALIVADCAKAADALDAKDTRIAELEAALVAIRDSIAPDSTVAAWPEMGFAGFAGFKTIARAALSNIEKERDDGR